ncbi:MAG TPA: ABC transporter ATP-binding protein [Gemmatimonadaceae bacterium]|nr:ABC transporter ATP-binding protein [Gemmatimonadaceae bacterium]
MAKEKYNEKRAWREARTLAWRHRVSLSLGLLVMLVNVALTPVLPAAPKFLIDKVLLKHDTKWLVPIVAAIGVATLIRVITSFALSQIVSIAAQRAITDLRKQVERHVLRLPVSYFDSTKSGVLVTRIMSDAEGVRNIVGTGLIQLVSGVLTAIIALVALLYFNWRLTLFAIVVLGAFGAMMSYAFSKLRPLFRERSIITADVTGRLTESLGGVRTLKVYVAERREQVVFAKGVHRLFRNIAKTITGTSAVGAGATATAGLLGVIVGLGGARAVLAGTMTIGDLFSYTFFIALMAFPLIQIASIGTQVSEAFAGLDRIREIMDMKTEDDHDREHAPLANVRGDVAFDSVSFAYVPGQPVLHEVSFSAPAGTTTALVGSSGSGKSTTLSLLMAFAKPDSGRILIDGQDLTKTRIRDYRSHLGVVMQDNFLFDGTVKDNIAFAKPGATDAEVRMAAKIAHCDEFVDRFPNGYDTIVGERGVKLSGGQRQRVAIARAIIADPRILILDEATSSLDSETEALIRDGLTALRSGRTTFVIAHRLSTIESADQILVLESGRIVERGRHEELLALGGRYRQLYNRQYGLETDLFANPGEEDVTPVPA